MSLGYPDGIPQAAIYLDVYKAGGVHVSQVDLEGRTKLDLTLSPGTYDLRVFGIDDAVIRARCKIAVDAGSQAHVKMIVAVRR